MRTRRVVAVAGLLAVFLSASGLEKYTAAERKHWAFRPVLRPATPPIQSPWVRGPIDAFVLQKLKSEGLAPASPASKTTLIRRVTLDLTGLPSTPSEVRAFVLDNSPTAYEK